MEQLNQLKAFLAKATKATYAGSGAKLEITQRPGFIELEFTEPPYYYRDSYAGFIRSIGQEVVWYDDKPFWSMAYGGGMTSGDYNPELAYQTFGFLKKAMSTGKDGNVFQPRGPNIFTDGDWRYESDWDGGISGFKGSEKISLNNRIVFTHDFHGGVIDWG